MDLVALSRLLVLNDEAKLTSVERGGKGFYDRRGKASRRLCGIGTFLHLRTDAFPKLSRAERRARSTWRPVTKRGKVARSTVVKGSSVHRHVRHALLCSKEAGCNCPNDDGPRRRPTRGSDIFRMVRGALEFVTRERIRPLAAEAVVACAGVPLGTRFDFLGADERGELTLVSWKTGYHDALEVVPAHVACSGEFVHACDPSELPSEWIAIREHVAQLCCEMHMLRDEHHVPVKRACIVYLSPADGSYRTIEMDHAWAARGGYERCWRWILSRSQYGGGDGSGASAQA